MLQIGLSYPETIDDAYELPDDSIRTATDYYTF